MNIFEIILIDSILLTFPMLVYLVYLSSNKVITKKLKSIYMSISYIASFFLCYKYGVNKEVIIPILILNSLVIIAYLSDKFILANIFSILIIILYINKFNSIFILIFIYIIGIILYLLKEKKIINEVLFFEIFVFISSLIYIIFIYKYNNNYFNLKDLIIINISYILICHIIILMQEVGDNVMKTHLSFKELQKEKQITMSLFKITHEIKNPIAVCKGYLDMINIKDHDQVERYIPIIKSEIERLLVLLQDFLLINKLNIDKDIMDLNLLIDETLESLNPILKEKNINVNLNLLDDEIYINGDYNRLSQVIINLLKNSLESIKDKGLIKISSKLKDNKYYLIIEDNGMGMTSDTLKKIKEPFFTTKLRGSGLGVSLIYEIVEAHGGNIKYSSEYGKGTKVTLYFPIA